MPPEARALDVSGANPLDHLVSWSATRPPGSALESWPPPPPSYPPLGILASSTDVTMGVSSAPPNGPDSTPPPPWSATDRPLQELTGPSGPAPGSSRPRAGRKRPRSPPGPPNPPAPPGPGHPPSDGPRLPERPYTGDFRGVSWNAQALFATTVRRQTPKQRHLASLIATNDFVMVQETHSHEGSIATWARPQATRFFASHGSPSMAGVGILVTEHFLAKFDPLPGDNQLDDTHWLEIEPGRVARLHLSGPTGSLDLIVCYHHTGRSREAKTGRRDSRAMIARALRPCSETLTILAGDFNYDARWCDRWVKDTPRIGRDTETPEEIEFMTTVAVPFGLHDLRQEDFTHDCALSRARLDRVYLNQHIACQLDRVIGCSPLAWVKALSDHRPLAFWRRTPSHEPGSEGPLPPQSIRHPDWLARVKLELTNLESQDTLPPSAIRRGILCKRAMRLVSRNIRKELAEPPPMDQADQLGHVVKFIRAVENRRRDRARTLAAAYPPLKDLVDLEAAAIHVDPGLDAVRDLAVNLARNSLLDEMRALQDAMAELPEQQKMVRKQSIFTKLRRLRPGTTSSLSSVQDANGHIHTEPEGIAAALAAHWARTFQGHPIDQQALRVWLQETLPPQQPHEPGALPPPDSPLWRVRRRDVARAVKISGNSAPGPDGIPYLAWRAMGELGIDILWDMLQTLSRPGAADVLRSAYADESADGHEFNLGILCCLPKRPSGNTENGTPYYAPENTRPLSIVNCDNRLLANAARIRWEEPLNTWVSQHQRGFLPHRSMLANVIDVDYEAMRVSLTQEAGAVILFDFQAAFPSVSHDFIFTTLRHLGLPQEALTLVESLYDSNKCLVSAQGKLLPGFDMRSGIRQGCPLSPLLFVVVVDSLLRHLHRQLPMDQHRAYADDIALVCQDFLSSLPTLQGIFARFHAVSGLRLNLPKTAIIPLGDSTPEQLQAMLHQNQHPWATANFTSWALYLGFATGPGKAAHSWDRPVASLLGRLDLWPWSSLGLQFATRAYNTFAFSVLSFVAQLENPPASAIQAERKALTRVAPGPGNWCTPEDLWHLQQAFGFSFRVRGLALTATAAQIRVVVWENVHHGGINLLPRAQELDRLIRGPDYPLRSIRLRNWYALSHLFTLRNAWQQLRDMRLNRTSLLNAIAGGPRPWTRETAKRVKSTTQGTVYNRLLNAKAGYAATRTADKLHRWNLGNTRTLADRILPRLRTLRNNVPPRVHAAVFSTLWNRWNTDKRHQRVEGIRTGCLLGCTSHRSLDSIEHYLRCPVVLLAAQRKLGLVLDPATSLAQLLLLGLPPEPRTANTWWARCALLVYAVYRTTNAARYGQPMTPLTAIRAIQQALIEGAKNHPKASRLVDGHWLQAQRPMLP